jgi:hypothetical protein
MRPTWVDSARAEGKACRIIHVDGTKAERKTFQIEAHEIRAVVYKTSKRTWDQLARRNSVPLLCFFLV